MSIVNAENVQLLSTIEASPGVLAGSPVWRSAEPDAIDSFTYDVKKVARSPLSRLRAFRKGTIVDLDANPGWTQDLTKDVLDSFDEGIMYSARKALTDPVIFVPTAVTATGFTVATGGDDVVDGTLFVTRNFINAANRGLKVAAGGSVAGEIKAVGLVAEPAPPTNVQLEVCGVQGGATVLGIDVNGNITSTVALDLTTLGLQVGSWIWVGGDPTNAALNFLNTAYRGYARVRAVTATLLTLDRRSWTVGAADPGTGKTIQIFFGRWLRNVPRDSADFKTVTYQYELSYPDLDGPGLNVFEYAKGCHHNKWTINAPLTNKATVKIDHIGMTMSDPLSAGSRALNAASAIAPVCGEAMNTSVSFNRLRVRNTDETEITMDMQSLTLEIGNNASGIKVLGNLGPKYVALGKFQVMFQAEVIPTSPEIIVAINDNRQVAVDFALRNDDFGALFDVPAMTLSSGDKKFPSNSLVTISPQFDAFADPLLGYTLGVTVFPYLPAA